MECDMRECEKHGCLCPKNCPNREAEPSEVSSTALLTCGWRETIDGFYESECGEAFEFTGGTPADNNFKFCPHCGKALLVNSVFIWILDPQ